MNNYKAVQIQIIDQQCQQLQDSISDLGCYYSLIKKDAKFIDVALFADSNNCVKISLSDPESLISMIIKNLTDKSVLGRLKLSVREILEYKQEYTQWYEFQSECSTQIKVQFKFILLQNDVASPSPIKSSLNNSQQYSLSSNSYQEQSANSSEKKQMIHPHYLTVGQEHDYPVISQFPTSPTFKRMIDAATQVECENQDLFTLKLDKEQLIEQYQQSQNQLMKLQQEYLQQNSLYKEYDSQIKLQLEEIQKMKIQIQNYQKEILLFRQNEQQQQQQKSQPLDDALIEQIKKLKVTIKQLEEQNQKQKLELANQLEISTNQQNQLNAITEKLDRNDSILQLTEEQNKYILSLNQQLVQREQQQNIIIQEQQLNVDQLEKQLKEQNNQIDKLNYTIKKENLFNSVLQRVQEQQLQSYMKIIGPLNEYLDQSKDRLLYN
ncbi:unnamed protein product (macronuclear) [Paramecium tetraurelia]|uniref:Spindle assembly abnormal protein 6 N-terminal domain-containing protein n=1 Tax=Paramecium tetraurelia TaxID=5888 RepID=A0BN76_PARTE|nr:uncharacterized protein GSPATT00030631001 [Paramecium tetraurelia]CAK59993.1 unnamed protein product [Paramecium tetraurelia]|eukprot:XP_001427391.1 hypothetical protein (macronuclear) [Paramecium tetraurelia strain d4-2]